METTGQVVMHPYYEVQHGIKKNDLDLHVLTRKLSKTYPQRKRIKLQKHVCSEMCIQNTPLFI